MSGERICHIFCKFNGGFKSVNTVDCNAVNILNGAVFGR